MAQPRDDTYDPDIPEANRNIQQGGGSGARDLARQRDPGEGADDAPTEDELDTTPDQP